MAKEEKVYQKRCNNLKNHIANDNLEQVKKAMLYEVDILDALRIDGSKITSIRMLKFLYEQLKAKAQEEDQGPSAAPILDAPPAKAAIAEDVVKLLLSKSTVFYDAINEMNKPQDPKAAAVEPQTLQQAHEFITFAHEICPQFDITANYSQFTIRGLYVETLPVFKFLISNEYSSDSALRLLERRQSALSKAIWQNDTEAIAEIAKYAPSKVKDVLKNKPNLLYDNINTPSTLQFLIDKKLVSSPNFNSRGIAKASFVDAIDANEPFTLKDAPQNIQICNLDMLKFYLSKELNINIAIARYTRLESLIKANDVAGVKAFVGLVIPKANPQMAIESLQKKIFNIKNLDIKTIGMMQIFLDAGFEPDGLHRLIPYSNQTVYDAQFASNFDLQPEVACKKLLNCTLTRKVAEFLLTKGASIDYEVLDYSVRHNQLLSFMLEHSDLSLKTQHLSDLMLHHSDFKTLDMFSLHKVIACMPWLQIQPAKDNPGTSNSIVFSIIDLKNNNMPLYTHNTNSKLNIISKINTKFAQFQEYLGKYVYGVLLEANISQDIAKLISSYCVTPNATTDLELDMRLGAESSSLFLETLAKRFLHDSKATPIAATEAQKSLLTMSSQENSIKIELEEARLACGATPDENAATRVTWAEYAEQVLQESIQDLSSQGQATEDGAAAAAPRIVDPHHVLLPGMDLWSSGMAPAQELLGLDLRDVE